MRIVCLSVYLSLCFSVYIRSIHPSIHPSTGLSLTLLRCLQSITCRPSQKSHNLCKPFVLAPSTPSPPPLCNLTSIFSGTLRSISYVFQVYLSFNSAADASMNALQTPPGGVTPVIATADDPGGGEARGGSFTTSALAWGEEGDVDFLVCIHVFKVVIWGPNRTI